MTTPSAIRTADYSTVEALVAQGVLRQMTRQEYVQFINAYRAKGFHPNCATSNSFAEEANGTYFVVTAPVEIIDDGKSRVGANLHLLPTAADQITGDVGTVSILSMENPPARGIWWFIDVLQDSPDVARPGAGESRKAPWKPREVGATVQGLDTSQGAEFA